MEDVIKKIHEYSLEEIMEERFARYSKYIMVIVIFLWSTFDNIYIKSV